MESTLSSETSAFILQTPGKFSKEHRLQLKGRHFSSDAEVIAAAETWLDGQPSDFFSEWLAKVRVWSLCPFLSGLPKDLPAPF